MWRDGGWGRVKCRLLYSVYCTVVEFYGGGGIWEVGLRYLLGCRLGKGGRVEGDEDVWLQNNLQSFRFFFVLSRCRDTLDDGSPRFDVLYL